MVGDERESDDSNDLPLDDSVYISKEEDTMEKMKLGLKKFGKGLKKGAEDIADGSKKFATKSKEKMDAAREERKKAKAMKDPLKFPWSNLSVVELKENLKGLGLKVSGKKDDLIERIMEHYKTEIPEMEDGTPHLIEDLELIEENPPAPDIDELIKEEEEVIEELTPTFEVVSPETPAIQFVGSEQLYVPDPPKNIKIKKDDSYKVINYVNFLFGLSMFFITLCILNKGFDFGINLGVIYDFIANRFVRSYGGMSDVQVTYLAGALSLMLFVSSMMYFIGRQKAAALLVVATVVVSISTRGIMAYAIAFDNDSLFYVIMDVVLSIPFCFSVWFPYFVRFSLEYDNTYQTSFLMDSGPESITGVPLVDITGDELSNILSTVPPKPIPPKRRQKGSWSIYEILFLALALLIWPFAIGLHVIMALEIRIESVNYVGDIGAHGPTLLVPLYLLCAWLTYTVVKLDRDARSGPIYAKEKLVYHETMDQYLEMYKAAYSKAAENAGINVQSDE